MSRTENIEVIIECDVCKKGMGWGKCRHEMRTGEQSICGGYKGIVEVTITTTMPYAFNKSEDVCNSCQVQYLKELIGRLERPIPTL